MKLLRLTTILCLLILTTGVPSSGQTLFRAASKDALVGTWDLVLTFSDNSQAKSVLTVMSGRDTGEGSVLHAAEASLLLPNPTTPEQGVWEHVSHRQFVASYFGFAVDGSFTAPAGRIGFRQHRITVSSSGETFRGTATFEVRDPAGVVLFSDTIQTVGRRQHP